MFNKPTKQEQESNKKINTIIKKLRKYIKKNKDTILFIERWVKFLYISIGIAIIFIVSIKPLANYYEESKNVKTVLSSFGIDKKYENQIHISKLPDFLHKNEGNILKIIYPKYEQFNYFQLIFHNQKKKKLEYYKIYKNINEQWGDYKNILNTKVLQNKIGVGLYNPTIENNDLKNIMSIVINLLFMGGMIFYIFWIIGAGKKSPLTLFSPNEKNKVQFEDIGGLESNKGEILEIIETLQNFKKFKERGVRAMRGILFFGPPGTGKTMIAKAIASQVGIDIFIASANDFGSAYINAGPQKVKKSYKEIEKFIKKHKRDYAILFVDELDSILKKRGSGHSEDDKVVNAFLDRIDGIEGSKNIILIGATNDLSSLDNAVLSRFDRKIGFTLPSKKDRIDIINKILQKRIRQDPLLKLSKELNIDIFAGNTEGMSGRDIENLLNEVHRRCVLFNKQISTKLIQETFMDVTLGRENKGLVYSKKDLDIVTYHELGHAFIAHLNGELAHTVTIIPRGQSLGSAWILPKNETNLKTPEALKKEIQRLVAGRMAEKFFMGEVTTGASNDYERATLIAISYFKDYNFELNGFTLGYILNNNNNNNQLIDSEIYKLIEKHVKDLIKEQENLVTDMINTHKNVFNLVLDTLLEKKVIFNQDFEELLPLK